MDHWPLLNALEYRIIRGFGIIRGLEISPETNNRGGVETVGRGGRGVKNDTIFFGTNVIKK